MIQDIYMNVVKNNIKFIVFCAKKAVKFSRSSVFINVYVLSLALLADKFSYVFHFQIFRRGEVVPVKVLGIIGLIDEGIELSINL